MKRHANSRSNALHASWNLNAQLWTAAVRESTIASRAAGTDQAIVNAVARCKPHSVIDIGCGEGWLVRRLSRERDCRVVGVDGSARLIDNARSADPQGIYSVLTYDRLSELPPGAKGPFDIAICNFALLDKDVAAPLQIIREILAADGRFIIQTLHPWTSTSDGLYEDGWCEETFDAFASENWQPMPWYFRTLGSWVREIERADMHLTTIEEPRDPSSAKPLSLVMVLQAN